MTEIDFGINQEDIGRLLFALVLEFGEEYRKHIIMFHSCQFGIKPLPLEWRHQLQILDKALFKVKEQHKEIEEENDQYWFNEDVLEIDRRRDLVSSTNNDNK